jgi:K+-transporting ATPase KdpF subunit
MTLRDPEQELTMTFEYALGGLLAAVLLVYLTYALVKAENF